MAASKLMRVHISVVLSVAAIVGVALMTQRALDLSARFPFNVLWISGIGGVLVIVLAGRYLKARAFGPANHVTLIRAALTAMLLALAAEKASEVAAWCVVVTAAAALTLDGVDGWLARRRGETSDFGARFDMETDALLILGASWLVWHHGKAGYWILAAGLMRYLFAGASWMLPWMRRPLPVRRRRKTIFVVQAISLIFCLAPLVPNPLSNAAALAGLALLTSSFLIDVVWLYQSPRATT